MIESRIYFTRYSRWIATGSVIGKVLGDVGSLGDRDVGLSVGDEVGSVGEVDVAVSTGVVVVSVGLVKSSCVLISTTTYCSTGISLIIE